ncbi:glycine/betaine ABC transporter permease [Leptospira sp. 2 VSF19]|uniref:Glycine/betaine ABC transporter permease n=1 Tax=Leptospira soteropolitanensis TaxID=2950025 RepID=A0AAW5VPV9_9LEPT|nr:glycine/betaine ABC transporter permease [Leptospira soteropolitanensis]MCW7494779.1 glycine/betaine ABC transporter permease [Leptospira soteropolitanensis]MCW7502370.1 glycine/betaine ABC transporter permease [Leptospira soteropolitanensis]MCW7524606.1 glycine/betaine ABC transporter permease [Leptospira soteropolitanensis]MCW7528475.1 glycine/betaine ABC transporter permease [Leptospira soteropolitanensis]MCW7532336.1 glycine/betaine ABC transporter permease [Leptospira soteropolitanensi
MNPLSLLEAIGQFFYWIIYLVNPNFREDEKIKEIERKEHQKLTLKIEKKKSQEKEIKEFEENRKNKINNNEDLIKICFDDPIFCDEYQILIEKIKTEIKNIKFKKEFEEEWNNTFSNINYGCYCRNKPNLTIYNNCPIDENSLDYACKSRHDCISSKNLTWNESLECNSDFSTFLDTIPYSNQKKFDSITNEEIFLMIANKYKALLSINNKIN